MYAYIQGGRVLLASVYERAIVRYAYLLQVVRDLGHNDSVVGNTDHKWIDGSVCLQGQFGCMNGLDGSLVTSITINIISNRRAYCWFNERSKHTHTLSLCVNECAGEERRQNETVIENAADHIAVPSRW